MLNEIWFLLIGVLFIGYVVLDGFDLGAGIVSLFFKKADDRKTILSAIGPVWDGNEVWLLTGGGALFAAFPQVYATVFSGFYEAMMLVLLALILRAVSIEFRNAVSCPRWARIWDLGFGIGSLLVAILLGVAFGNLLRGLPLDASGIYRAGFFALLNPYGLIAGIFSVLVLSLHGICYLGVKTSWSDRLARCANGLWAAVVVGYTLVGVSTVFFAPARLENFRHNGGFWIFLLLSGAAVIGFPLIKKWWVRLVFSGTICGGCVALGAATMYPYLVPPLVKNGFGWTIINGASGPETLRIMLIIALIGMPLVLGYTIGIYWFFRHKVDG